MDQGKGDEYHEDRAGTGFGKGIPPGQKPCDARQNKNRRLRRQAQGHHGPQALPTTDQDHGGREDEQQGRDEKEHLEQASDQRVVPEQRVGDRLTRHPVVAWLLFREQQIDVAILVGRPHADDQPAGQDLRYC